MADYFSTELNDEYDIYGKTPPRTKILRKHREKRQREKNGNMPSSSKGKSSISRRNTVGYIYDEMVSKAEMTDSDHGGSGGGVVKTRMSKRLTKLLRGSERDLKLDIASAQAVQNMNGSLNHNPPTPQPSFQVECNERFMSLSNRTVFICASNRHSYDSKLEEQKKQIIEDKEDENDDSLASRVDFHRTLCLLIKIGISDKQQDRNTKRCPSRDDQRWHEYRDVIWLELRAYHASRTIVEEDEFLCKARKEVAILLKEIMTYRFEPKTCIRWPKELQNQNGKRQCCSGCSSIHCVTCLEAQTEALKEIGELSLRLERAEALFPSGKAFAEMYPVYRSPEFEGRVATISLWVNITRLHRISLMLLGRFLFFLDTKNCNWSTPCDRSMSDMSSSPSDSNNSSSSNDQTNEFKFDIDYLSNNFLLHLMKMTEKEDSSPYRKYIENVLKTQALKKSLNFLDKLHVQVLNKAVLTLEKPENEDVFTNLSLSTEENELRRYGAWSPEAKDINLPSYRAAFLFLAAVPLEVIHQFMLLRLEQRPPNPSPLSIRQLMRELKEGLNVALTHRNRAEKYISAVERSTDLSIENYVAKLRNFDECMEQFFVVYLDYLEKWALLEHETFQKNLLEEEWDYCCSIIHCIPNRQTTLEHKFCQILSSILYNISERLRVNVENMVGSIQNDDYEIKYNILAICRELQTLLNEEREMSIKTLSFCKKIFKHNVCLEAVRTVKDALFTFKCTIPDVIEKIQSMFLIVDGVIDEVERITLVNRVREILMQAYKIGFEFYKEMTDFIPQNKRKRLVMSLVQFANLWMKFVVEKCERGRGMRPRWAMKGLEFLLTVVEPKNTKYLSQSEFDQLKTNMDRCISHVIGTTAPSTPDSGLYSASPRSSNSGRSRGSSPSPRPAYRNKTSRRKISHEKMSSPSDSPDSFSFESSRKLFVSQPETTLKSFRLPQSRATEAVERLDEELDDRLRRAGLIGKVLNTKSSSTRIRQKYVKFTWQRGIKVGEGRFGKVYTAVNNSTGEMMAVKEIVIQHNDKVSVMRVTDEMKILEGIVHRHLVKYYGVEIHRDEMLIFMEYCQEGTLENIVAASVSGLSELIVRRYTFQLLSGVQCLHDHGVVHRDIKPANIFMTKDSNWLKIGDFGCAAKIKSHTTAIGELKGLVGTQAYMAPEVFSGSQGHGRAADIWSVGCVVVEMASGKRPWSQYETNYQIMFRVGMGSTPDPPEDMIDEGLDFLDLCFKFDPRQRATAQDLLNHDFVKVGVEDP